MQDNLGGTGSTFDYKGGEGEGIEGSFVFQASKKSWSDATFDYYCGQQQNNGC